jgi:hypothetical protein
MTVSVCSIDTGIGRAMQVQRQWRPRPWQLQKRRQRQQKGSQRSRLMYGYSLAVPGCGGLSRKARRQHLPCSESEGHSTGITNRCAASRVPPHPHVACCRCQNWIRDDTSGSCWLVHREPQQPGMVIPGDWAFQTAQGYSSGATTPKASGQQLFQLLQRSLPSKHMMWVAAWFALRPSQGALQESSTTVAGHWSFRHSHLVSLGGRGVL